METRWMNNYTKFHQIKTSHVNFMSVYYWSVILALTMTLHSRLWCQEIPQKVVDNIWHQVLTKWFYIKICRKLKLHDGFFSSQLNKKANSAHLAAKIYRGMLISFIFLKSSYKRKWKRMSNMEGFSVVLLDTINLPCWKFQSF